jgi:hypothetical protein
MLSLLQVKHAGSGSFISLLMCKNSTGPRAILLFKGHMERKGLVLSSASSQRTCVTKNAISIGHSRSAYFLISIFLVLFCTILPLECIDTRHTFQALCAPEVIGHLHRPMYNVRVYEATWPWLRLCSYPLRAHTHARPHDRRTQARTHTHTLGVTRRSI